MRALKLAVATASVTMDTGPPRGLCSSSFSISRTAFWATGFLLRFLAFSSFMVIL